MRYFNKKSQNNRGIAGITGVLLLILGVGSLIFQYSTTVDVYAQVDLGPFINIGPPNRSDGQDSDSDRSDTFTAYKDAGAEKVYLAKLVSNSSGRAVAQEDAPQQIIDGGEDPAIDVTPGGKVYVAAEQQNKIAFVGCSDDDDNCSPSKIVSNPTTVPPPVGIEGEGGKGSCTDNLDNDADKKTDLADTDCKWSSEQVSSQRGLCSDDNDNDNDTKIDSADEDCFHPSRTPAAADTDETPAAADTDETPAAADTDETAGTEDTDETAGTEDTDETAGTEDTDETAGTEDNDTAGVEPTSFNVQPVTTTSSPQLTFVQTGGGGAPPASNTDIASSNDGRYVYVVWQQDGGEIMLAASQDSGATWKIVNVSKTPTASTDPRVATSTDGQNVHVTWHDTPGSGDIFYARSTDRGVTFGTSINLSNTSGSSDFHQLLAEGSNVYVVWVDSTTTAGGQIYFKKSNDDGASFSSNTINLSAGTGQSFQSVGVPDMAAHGDNVAVTWAAFPDRNRGQGEILVRESHDKGVTFDKQINASQTSRTNSIDPQVDYTPESLDEIYVAFLDMGGPKRVSTAENTFNVLATEREDGGRPFSPLVNLSDDPKNPAKSASQLEVIFDVAIWDPSGRRG